MYAIDSPITTEKHGSQIEEAYWCLRQEIIDGSLKPTEKLGIDFLRQKYGFGASGIREALSRLVSDGLAESEPQRGFRVSPVNREELRDITASRQVIEVEALRQSMASRAATRFRSINSIGLTKFYYRRCKRTASCPRRTLKIVRHCSGRTIHK